MLVTTLLVAALAAAPNVALSPSAPSTDGPRCGRTLPHWVAAKAPLGRTRQVKNTIRLEDDRLLWNGAALTEPMARQYLAMVKLLSPQPLTVLTYGARTSCGSVRRTRSLIQNVLRCKPGECIEAVSSRR